MEKPGNKSVEPMFQEEFFPNDFPKQELFVEYSCVLCGHRIGG
jgi:hypothetical protein